MTELSDKLELYEVPSGGASLPNGGTDGQVLTKTSSVDGEADWEDLPAGHAAVTLDANADTLLSLSTQALGLDTQAANLALMGPVTGAAAVPTFRSPQAKDVTIPDGLGTPTYDDIQDFLNTTRSAGRLTGGTVSKGTGATVSITAMDGMIFTGSTLGTSPLIYFKKAAQTSITPTGLTDGAVNWIYIDYDGGSLTYKATTDRTTVDNYTMFTIARIWVSGSTLEVQASGHSLYNKDRRAHNRLILKYGGMDRVSGGTLSAITVGGASGQGIQTDAGSWYIANTPFTTSAVTTYYVWYKSGSATWVKSGPFDTFDDVFDGGTNKLFETYQNGNSLATLSAGRYGVYWIFICPEGELYVVMDSINTGSIATAQAATVPATLPPYCVNFARLCGRVICKKSNATHYSVESSFAVAFTLSAAVDHSSLANLSADDHTQYLLVSGTRAMAGDIDFAATYQCHDLQAPAANGEAIRATTKITELLLESATDLKHTAGTDTALGAVSTKNPPIDADKCLYRDSTASDALVTSTWAQVKAFLKTYFDTLYNLYAHPNHSGDVTSVADGATTIANSAVTLAKMADLAQDKILGRITASTGAPEAITGANVRTITGLATTDSPVFATVKLSGLTDGYLPYHVDDSTGLANGPTKTDVDDAVSKKHAAITVSAPIVLTGQAIELKNNAGSPAQVTAIDVGALANSDTVIPTSKAVTTALAGLEGCGSSVDVTQASHGLAVGDVIRHNGTIYVKAKADTSANAEAVGIVSAVDGNDFTYTTGGLIEGLSGLTAGVVYFLSAATAGLLTATEPSTDGQISKPLLIATATTEGIVCNMRGMVIGGTGLFNINVTGDLEPITDVLPDDNFDLDANDDIQPRAA